MLTRNSIIVLALLIWTIIKYRRVSAHGDYSRRTSNVKGYGFNDGLEPEYARSRASSLIDKRRQRRSQPQSSL
jgi:hypothetical protein